MMGLALVGNDAVQHDYHCVSYTTRIPFLFYVYFLEVTMMVIELNHTARGGEPQVRTRGMIASRSVNMVRHPRGSYTVAPIAVSGVATPENKVNHWRWHH